MLAVECVLLVVLSVVCGLLLVHCPLFIVHCSLSAAGCCLFIAGYYCSSFCSQLLVARCVLVGVCFVLFGVWRTVCGLYCVLLVGCVVVVARCFLFVV